MKLIETNCWDKPQVETGIIRNVKLLGEVSKNNRIYPRAVRVAAHKLFEGARVSLNHMTHDVQGRIGRIVNVREQPDGSYGDFEYLTNHPYASTIKEAAEKMPEILGFSISSMGRAKKDKASGKDIVESIHSIMSIDLVDDPATTKGLFESAEEPAESKGCEQILGELIAALVAEGKEDFVKDAIKLKKKIVGESDDEEEPKEETPKEEEPEKEESWKQDYKKLKLEKDCRILIESKKLQVEEPLLETLTALPNEEAREKFLNWHQRKSAVKQTRSSDVIALSESTKTQLEESNKDFAKILRGK